MRRKKGPLALFLALALAVMGAFAVSAAAQEGDAVDEERNLTVTASGLDVVFSAFDEPNNRLFLVADTGISPETSVTPEERTQDDTALAEEDEDVLFNTFEDEEIDEAEEEEILNLISENEQLTPFPEGTNITLANATVLEVGTDEGGEPIVRTLLVYDGVTPSVLETAADVAAEDGAAEDEATEDEEVVG